MKTIFVIIGLIIILSPSTFCQSEATICYNLFRSSYEITEFGQSVVDEAAWVVWLTRSLNSNVLTLTGTITQSTSNYDVWLYSSTPTNQLRVVYANGFTEVFIFSSVDGYFGSSWESLSRSHNMNYRVTVTNFTDIQVQSQSIPNPPGTGAVNFQRQFNGYVIDAGTTWTFNINHTGRDSAVVDYNWAHKKYSELVTGTSSTSSMSFTINESYFTELIYYNNVYTQQKRITNNSSVSVGGVTYKYQNAYVNWIGQTQFADSANAGRFNVAIEQDKWYASGTLLKNDAHLGNVIFGLPPQPTGQYGNSLYIQTINSDKYLIHPLLRWWLTVDVIKSDELPQEFHLSQNYPNPFNPSTVIIYQVPADVGRNGISTYKVTLKVYNILGQEVATLVNETQDAGFKSVEWNASGMASGVYMLRMEAGNPSSNGRQVPRQIYVNTKKMILVR
ncbi:MAG: T9SS type A sorting domain-containing protein [Bacteroidota bacterium]|nr:T9SS type A sorting domain-containing protein [Bacteroidota bacterium]